MPTRGGERQRQACSISNEVNTVPLMATGGKANSKGGWVMSGFLGCEEDGSVPVIDMTASLSSKSTK